MIIDKFIVLQISHMYYRLLTYNIQLSEADTS